MCVYIYIYIYIYMRGVAAKIFQGLGPKRRGSRNGDRVYGTYSPVR